MEPLNTTTTQDLTPPKTPGRQDSFIVEIIRFSVIALIIVIPIRLFIAQPFIVSGASMEPTFQSGEYLIVDQVTYRFEEPERGDVIIFRYPRDPSKFFIKRVIATPGETIEIKDNVITIKNSQYTDGVVLDEPYVAEMRPGEALTEKLDENEYFVMGDNRNASSDSRSWGVLEEEFIVGRALIRLLPVTEINILPGKTKTNAPTQTLETTKS